MEVGDLAVTSVIGYVEVWRTLVRLDVDAAWPWRDRSAPARDLPVTSPGMSR